MTDQLDPESRARLAAAVAAAEADAMLREAADYERWRARAEQAEAAIDRVRDLHIEVDGTPWAEGGCVECGHDYPCATLRALDGTQPPAEPAEPVAPGPATDLGPLREALYGAHDTDQAGDAR